MRNRLKIHSGRRKGIALVTTLMLASIFIALIMAFFYLIERDYYTARTQECSQQAFYVAFSGLEFGVQNPTMIPRGSTIHRSFPSGSTTHGFDLSRLSNGSLRCVGRVTYDNGRVVHRVLLLKVGRPATRFQEVR